jgi:hypothetical protein
VSYFPQKATLGTPTACAASALREPERNEFGEARLCLRIDWLMTVPLDGARHAAIRSNGAGWRCARDGMTAMTSAVRQREGREGWQDENEAAEALGTTPEQVRSWRHGSERMAVADYIALTSVVNVALADAMRTGEASDLDLSGAAEALGVSSRRPERARLAEDH